MWLKPHLAEVHPPLGWGPWPCATSPYPATDRLEAKQLRMCLLSKRVEVLRQKSKKSEESLKKGDDATEAWGGNLDWRCS